MANNGNQRQFLASKLEALTESEVGEVLDYISVMESNRPPKNGAFSPGRRGANDSG